MTKKAFSLLEIIFVLIVMSVITTLAVSKFDTAFTNTNVTKIKSDILQIRAGINSYKSKMILKDSDDDLEQLDDNDIMLFNKILENPILSSNEPIVKAWTKLSNSKYKVYVTNHSFLEFHYDNETYIFDCDISNELCKELNL
jgi:general secretion pathway protein G